MSKKKYGVSAAAGVIATLFSIFGSFLTKIAAPLENQKLAVGLAEFICLILLLWILRYTKTPKRIKTSKMVILILLILAMGGGYYLTFSKWVVTINGVAQVKGDLLKKEWLDECRGSGVDGSCEEYILKKYGNQPYLTNTSFWSKASILKYEAILLAFYVLFTLLICTIVFTFFDRDASLEEAGKKEGKVQTQD